MQVKGLHFLFFLFSDLRSLERIPIDRWSQLKLVIDLILTSFLLV